MIHHHHHQFGAARCSATASPGDNEQCVQASASEEVPAEAHTGQYPCTQALQPDLRLARLSTLVDFRACALNSTRPTETLSWNCGSHTLNAGLTGDDDDDSYSPRIEDFIFENQKDTAQSTGMFRHLSSSILHTVCHVWECK